MVLYHFLAWICSWSDKDSLSSAPYGQYHIVCWTPTQGTCKLIIFAHHFTCKFNNISHEGVCWSSHGILGAPLLYLFFCFLTMPHIILIRRLILFCALCLIQLKKMKNRMLNTLDLIPFTSLLGFPQIVDVIVWIAGCFFFFFWGGFVIGNNF